MWLHPGSKSFDELNVGDRYVTAGRTMTETDIQVYAGLSGDYHAYHTNEVIARAGDFGGRICHGLLTISVLSGLFRCRLGLFDGTGLGTTRISKVRFLKPVRPGDTIHADIEVAGKGEGGIAVLSVKGVNQSGELVAECEWSERVLASKPAIVN